MLLYPSDKSNEFFYGRKSMRMKLLIRESVPDQKQYCYNWLLFHVDQNRFNLLPGKILGKQDGRRLLIIVRLR